MKRSLLFISVLLFFNMALAQEGPTPAQTLRLARATYEQGRLHEIETQLNSEVISQMAKQEKVEAYKILCLSFIYLEESDKADNAMLNILNTDPYFLINEAVDPAEFVALFKTFRREPIYRIGVTLGGNFTQPNVSEVTNTLDGTAEYKAKFGLQFGVSVDYPLTFFSNKLSLHGDLMWQQKKFELTTRDNQGDSDINSTVAIESQAWIALPISIQYNILKSKDLIPRKFNPYVSLGISTDLLISSSLNAERTREGETSIEPTNFDVKPQRESINFSVIGAAGVKTRFAGGLIGVEIRYIYGLSEISNNNTAYDNNDLYLTYGIPNVIFKLNSASFAATYVQNIFKPKKLSPRK